MWYSRAMTCPSHTRRFLLLAVPAAVSLAACQQGPRIYDMKVSRDTGCTCCTSWVEEIEKTGRFKVAMFDAGDLPTFKRGVGVPPGLGSCHTGLVESYVIEGHVPAEDILRLIAERPKDVTGLAVPGMPRGSLGMMQMNGAMDPYKVFAFKADKSYFEFSSYPANT
jgi:hypothetical protein